KANWRHCRSDYSYACDGPHGPLRCPGIANDSQYGASGMAHFSQIARRCERAVVTAYSELRDRGTDDLTAFESCTTLYQIHHPEASLGEARRLVAEWVDRHLDRSTGQAKIDA